MAKKKTKSPVQPVNSSRRRRRARNRFRTTYETAVIDPFDPRALGAKVPDFDSNPSYTICSKDLWTITADANGFAGNVLFFSTPQVRNVGTSSITGGNFAFGGSRFGWSDLGGTISTTTVSGIRLVGGGLRISNLLSSAGSTAASGRLIIAPASASTLTALVIGSGSVSESTARRLPGAKVYSLASLASSSDSPVGHSGALDPSAHCYVIPTMDLTSTANDFPNHMGYILLVVGVAAGSTCIEVEQIAHWEVLPTPASASLANGSAMASVSMLERVSNLVSNIDWVTTAEWAYDRLAASTNAPQLSIMDL